MEERITSPLKAIRAKCVDCMCGQREEIKVCPSESCPLYPFRFGKNPFNRRELTPEQKAAAAERLAAVRSRRHE